VIFFLEGLGTTLYGEAMDAALAEHSVVMSESAGALACVILASLLAGLALVFFYVMARSRLGAGPKTAVTVAIAFWAGGYAVSLIQHSLIGLFPSGVLSGWAAVSFVEYIVAALVGGWLYREATN
jgi:hypothetical protein